ncbi:SDR family oxidoreductase [Oculatella sp. LEGE 06141]|uniref:SDR family NAD(P)-dependent oxidoreductase n=1 Tax=Oculatella sp. LEGE 06141 TaxID=1828648 RepID=UPI00187E6AC2|nr:SDR family oxidoreductase [Oculatella sp. LEGE 06141]MBE9179603.1 SDR family oxidoreductase [Oculatella sp. LEGE 06141]
MTSTVLITGASQGIGKATAHLFARQGYNLILAARQADRLEATAAELRQVQHAQPELAGTSTLAIPTDVKDPQQVEALVQEALARHGAIDVLVNNAGVYISGPAEQFSLADWHQAIDTNLWGYIHTIHALLPHFLERRAGNIVNIGSVGGKVPLPYLAPYTTSKFAITGLTAALHSELAPKGIHVCGIYPNLIKTNFLERAIFRGQDDSDRRARRQQVEQILQVPVVEQPEDVAQAVWDAIKHQHSEVIVGSAKLSTGTNQLFPQLLQWILRKTFQNRDRVEGKV